MIPKTSGMRVFLTVWAGQLVSLLGSALGSFALGVWVYQTTGSATRFALAPFAGAATGILLLPIAGMVADRWDRRRIMFLSDVAGTLLTMVATWLLFSGQLRVWHVYLLVMGINGASTFQTPAFSAAITTLVPREQLARASGMVQSARAISMVAGPICAGLLIALIGYHGLMAVDCVTFTAGLATLAVVRFPRPKPSEQEKREEGRRSLWRDAFFGWVYIRARPGLFRLLGLFACTNFALGMLTILLTPLVLSFSTVAELGTVRGASASGLLVGGLLLTLWGGPERRMPTIFAALAAQATVLFLAAAPASVVLIAAAGFLFTLFVPFINGLSQAIWQSKVPQDVQGRVFAIRVMIAMSALPVAFLVAGPLADHVFEPLMMPGGALADSVGRWIGVGPGRGIGLLFLVLGVAMLAITGLGALSPRLRHLETEVPDAGVEPERAAAEELEPDELDPVGV